MTIGSGWTRILRARFAMYRADPAHEGGLTMRWIAVLAMVAALGLVASGCGSKNSSSATATEATTTEAATEQTTTEEAATDETTTDETMTDEMTTDETSTEATATDGALGALSGECQDLVTAGEAFGAALSSAAGSGGNDDLGATADAYKAFADKAPAALKDDFEVLASVIGEYADAIKDIGLKPGSTPNATQIAKLVKLSQSFNSGEVQKASNAISRWTTENCGQNP
jgi:hypothetical protein